MSNEMKIAFEKFLELPETKRFEYLTGIKLRWWQRLELKVINIWWSVMRTLSPKESAIDVWERIYKQKF